MVGYLGFLFCHHTDRNNARKGNMVMVVSGESGQDHPAKDDAYSGQFGRSAR